MSDQSPAAVSVESGTASTAFDNIPEQLVPLSQIGVAPENLRADEPADEEVPQLAETLFHGGQVFPLLVRPGRGKKEAAFMALDGRRRRLAYLHLVEAQRISPDHPVRVKVITDKDTQVRAAYLPNSEAIAPDLVDVIRATGRLAKRSMSPAQIARSLGYSREQVLGWSVLAGLEDVVLEGLRDGKITLRQAKLMTKLSPQDQAQLADNARIYGRLYDDAVRNRLSGAVVTVGDARVRLVGLEAYAAAGGRVETDLFGEMPDVLLDQAILQQAWDERVKVVVDHLEAAGLKVFFDVQNYCAPEGFERVPHLAMLDVAEDQQETVDIRDGERAAAVTALCELETLPADGLQPLLGWLTAELAYLHALGLAVGACNLAPDGRKGVQPTFFIVPPLPEAPEDDEPLDDARSADEREDRGVRRIGDIDVPRIELQTEVQSHSLVERYTDIATRGLIRSLADDPSAALVLLAARLFVATALQRTCDSSESSTISTIKAQAYRRTGHQSMPALDGDVYARLEARRETYLETGLRPIPWVASLSHGDRMTFLAELVAITLDGREFATHAPRHGARAEALELVELTGHDIRNFWLPDNEFFAAHNKGQLVVMLEAMGEDGGSAAALKKADLAARVTTAAGGHHWAPGALSWTSAAPAAVDEGGDDEGARALDPTDPADYSAAA
jgi:ParB family chromosome partitioning protein